MTNLDSLMRASQSGPVLNTLFLASNIWTSNFEHNSTHHYKKCIRYDFAKMLKHSCIERCVSMYIHVNSNVSWCISFRTTYLEKEPFCQKMCNVLTTVVYVWLKSSTRLEANCQIRGGNAKWLISLVQSLSVIIFVTLKTRN